MDYTDCNSWREHDFRDEDYSSDIKSMVWKIPTKITVVEDEMIVFWFTDGSVCRFYHDQNCCETVTIADVCGDFEDLINHPIIVADERTYSGEDSDYESFTYTFYTFRGTGGSVDVRWNGYSNGYYSEAVDFEMVTAK